MKEKIISFFTDVVKEMNKVTWPKKDDLRDSTVIVLVVCLIIARSSTSWTRWSAECFSRSFSREG